MWNYEWEIVVGTRSMMGLLRGGGRRCSYWRWAILCMYCTVLGLNGELYLANNNKFEEIDDDQQRPTIFVAILVRNKAHALPYFLGNFENLDYPKDRMRLWIRSDHNEDDSVAVLNKWVSAVRGFYHAIDIAVGEDGPHDDERGPLDWPESRMQHMIALREEALRTARGVWSDYLLTIDADNILTRPDTLNRLILQNKTIVAPMLKSDQTYSNFWGGMSDQGYYERTEQYKELLDYEITGCFTVPMVHSTVLVNLRSAKAPYLTHDPELLAEYIGEPYDGPVDDIIVFAKSAQFAGLPMWILNSEKFGFLVQPLDETMPLAAEVITFQYQLLEALREGVPGVIYSPFVPPAYPAKDRMGVNEVYLVNLDRRVDRRQRMEMCFDIIGIDAYRFPAVDGASLSEDYIKELGVKVMPEYKDPFHGRTMTRGEIACFLSHYDIWKDIVYKGFQRVIVFEDDLRFMINFKNRMTQLLAEADSAKLDWDLIYIGRKRLNPDVDGPIVEGTSIISHVSYSYWTLGYVLTLRGARKLLAGDPLKRLVPVDEYLPIMFDKHPEKAWAAHYPTRDLVAFTAEPLLVHPTHYTGQPGYITDTENSDVIPGVIGDVTGGDGERGNVGANGDSVELNGDAGVRSEL